MKIDFDFLPTPPSFEICLRQIKRERESHALTKAIVFTMLAAWPQHLAPLPEGLPLPGQLPLPGVLS